MWLILGSLLAGQSVAQQVQNKRYDRLLRLMLNNSMPTLSAAELNQQKASVLVLDARKPAEFAVSHVAGAVPVGYKQLDLRALNNVAKDWPIAV